MYSNRDFDQENTEELQRLKAMEDRLELAIKTYEVYLEAMGDNSYKDAILRKSVALNFTLDILKDIRNGDGEDGN